MGACLEDLTLAIFAAKTVCEEFSWPEFAVVVGLSP